MTHPLSPQTLTILDISLPDYFSQKEELTHFLDEVELQRAHRFKFEIHRDRFIIARALLRKILSHYVNVDPAKIKFDYGSRGKPYLHDNLLELQFNVSHSEDRAIYAITQKNEIGVDIEKIQDNYKEAVAKRFFTEKEYQQLTRLPAGERSRAFYETWVRKEAVIKAIGEGLFASLSDFSTEFKKEKEEIVINAQKVYLSQLEVGSDYSAAVATLQPILEIEYLNLLTFN